VRYDDGEAEQMVFAKLAPLLHKEYSHLVSDSNSLADELISVDGFDIPILTHLKQLQDEVTANFNLYLAGIDGGQGGDSGGGERGADGGGGNGSGESAEAGSASSVAVYGPCACNSGKLFRNCHGIKYKAERERRQREEQEHHGNKTQIPASYGAAVPSGVASSTSAPLQAHVLAVNTGNELASACPGLTGMLQASSSAGKAKVGGFEMDRGIQIIDVTDGGSPSMFDAVAAQPLVQQLVDTLPSVPQAEKSEISRDEKNAKAAIALHDDVLPSLGSTEDLFLKTAGSVFPGWGAASPDCVNIAHSDGKGEDARSEIEADIDADKTARDLEVQTCKPKVLQAELMVCEGCLRSDFKNKQVRFPLAIPCSMQGCGRVRTLLSLDVFAGLQPAQIALVQSNW